MNKGLKTVFGTLVLIIVLILFYFLTFQLSHKRLVIKESTSIISLNNLGKSNMNRYYKLYEKVTQKNSSDLSKYSNYIKGIDLIYFSEDKDVTEVEKPEENYVLAVNVGWNYPMVKFEQKKYFDSLGKNYFELKKLYEKELSDKYGFKGKVYMTNYKGYYFLSDDVMKLSNYLRLLVKKGINKNIASQLKGDTLGEAIFDIDLNPDSNSLTALKMTLDYEDNSIKLNGNIYGDIDFSEYFKALDSKDRKLDKYMAKDRIYLTSQNFRDLTKFIRGNMNPQLNNQLSIIKMLTGKELEDYTDKIDGELIYDYSTNQVILPLKETKELEELLKMTAKKDGNNYTFGNNYSLELRNKIVYYNGKMNIGDLEVPKDEFINASINLGIYSPQLTGIYINLGAKADGKEIKIRSEIEEENFVKAYQQMEASK